MPVISTQISPVATDQPQCYTAAERSSLLAIRVWRAAGAGSPGCK